MRPMEIRVTENGGDPVLWLPGSTFSFEHYRALSEALPGTHVLVDNPFHHEELRPEDWEEQLLERQREVATAHDCVEIVAHSRGVLQAGELAKRMNAERETIRTLFLLHPPVAPCSGNEKRLPAGAHGHLAFLDLVMAQTCRDMGDEDYRLFLQSVYDALHGNMQLLKGILKADLRMLAPALVHGRIADIAEHAKARILAIAGTQDPWHDPAALRREGIDLLELDTGHWAHLTQTAEVVRAISAFRKGESVVRTEKNGGEAEEISDELFAGF